MRGLNYELVADECVCRTSPGVLKIVTSDTGPVTNFFSMINRPSVAGAVLKQVCDEVIP